MIQKTDFKLIMEHFNAGDFESRKKAVDMLYRAYSQHYLIVIKREFMSNRYDNSAAEDILQDAFLSLTSKMTKPSSEFAISSWLKSYIYNITRDNMKKAYRNREQSEEVIPVLPGDSDNSDSVASIECIKQVVIAYGKEDPEGMELFTAVKTEGKAYSELTNLYGKTVSNLKRIVSEVNKLVQESIQPCLDRKI